MDYQRQVAMNLYKITRAILVITAIAVGLSCDHDKGKQNQTFVANPAQYDVTVSIVSGNCSQTIKKNGILLPGTYSWVPISKKNQDFIIWHTDPENANDSVTFPANNASSTLPGTPFGQYTIQVEKPSGPATLTETEGTEFYFQYSVATVNGTVCTFPLQGMGVHVTQ